MNPRVWTYAFGLAALLWLVIGCSVALTWGLLQEALLIAKVAL